MSKMVYLPYVCFEQEEGEAEGTGWYFTQYDAETGEGLQESDDGKLYGTDTLEYYKLSEIRLTSCKEDMKRYYTDEAAEWIANYTWNAYGSFSRFAEKNKDRVFRVIVRPEFCGDVPEDSFDARRCKMSSVVTLPDDDVLIGLRMLDIAQVEYRKLSEVHLQWRADDNQPE